MMESLSQTSPEQRAQHALSIFVSKSSALLTEFLTAEASKEKDFTLLAGLLFRLNQSFEQQIEKYHSIDELFLQIGMKETTQKNLAITRVVSAFSTAIAPQRVVSEKLVTLITPSIIPDLHVFQTQQLNGNVTNRLQVFYLVGPAHLPADYQNPLIKPV